MSNNNTSVDITPSFQSANGYNKKPVWVMGIGVFSVFLLLLVIAFSYQLQNGQEEAEPRQQELAPSDMSSKLVNAISAEHISPIMFDHDQTSQENPLQKDFQSFSPTQKTKKEVVHAQESKALQETELNGLSEKDFTIAAASPLKVNLSFPQNVQSQSPHTESSVNSLEQQELQNITRGSSMLGLLGEASADQNMQSAKTAYLKETTKDDKDYLNSRLKKPLSPYEIKAGSILPAILVTGINSDLPGQIIARLSRNLYDTVSGNFLLLPQGTTLIGTYDSQVAYGQSRVLMVWHRMIFPNGKSFDLEGMPGADLVGMAGLHDLVNNHYMRIFGSALLFSVFGALGQLSQPQQDANSLTTQQIIYGAVGQEMSQTAARMVAKNLNIQPTLEIRPGTEFNVILTRDMVLPGVYH